MRSIENNEFQFTNESISNRIIHFEGSVRSNIPEELHSYQKRRPWRNQRYQNKSRYYANNANKSAQLPMSHGQQNRLHQDRQNHNFVQHQGRRHFDEHKRSHAKNHGQHNSNSYFVKNNNPPQQRSNLSHSSITSRANLEPPLNNTTTKSPSKIYTAFT